MKSKQYWTKRAAQRMVDYMDDTEKVAAEITEAYQKSAQVLNREAETILRTFQSHHHLTEAEARRLIRHAKGKTVTDKLKAALETITDEEKKAKVKAAIDAPAYKYRIGRLEALGEDIERQCGNLYGVEQKALTGHLRGLCDEAYLRTMFDVQQGTGLEFSFAQMPTSRINEILKNNWSGEHYSQRIWGEVTDMGAQLKDELLVSFMSGRSMDKTAAAIAERFGVGASDARRLARTESNYVANQAEMDSYAECGVEKYEFVATLDARTSDVCAALDGKVFPVKEQQPGVNAPPMHPYCRSTTIAHFDDDVMEELQRRARDPETGKTYLVPADMTYPEWKKKYVAKSAKGDIINNTEMYRKGDDRRGFKFISDKEFERLTIQARKNGATILRGTEEIERHLDAMGASAATIGEIMLFRHDVCVSEVLEETCHFMQNMRGMNDDKAEPLRTLLNEIDAKQYVLTNAHKYRVPRNEIELTQRQLEGYKKQFETFMKGGGSD